MADIERTRMNDAFAGEAGAPPGSSPGILPGVVVPEGVERQLLADLEEMRESVNSLEGAAEVPVGPPPPQRR